MANGPINTLLITDREADVERVTALLDQCENNRFLVEWVASDEQARLAIKANHYDIFLLCCSTDNSASDGLGNWSSSINSQFGPPLLLLVRDDDAPQTSDYQPHWLAASIAFERLRWQDLSSPLLEKSILSAMRHRANETRLLKLAYYDPMTGLANRLLFRNKLQEHIAQARRGNQWLALFMLDLDGFKQVNDRLGHDAGDDVLVSVAERLRHAVRETDTIARLGGDEFGVIATQIHSAADCSALATSILRCCQITLDVGDVSISISTSIGISLFPDDASNPEELLRKADQALLHSKLSGRCNYHFADENVDSHHRAIKLLQTDIRDAINRQQLALVFQPIIDLEQRGVVGVEALLRWHHHHQGLIFPEQFIPIAEHTGAIHPIGAWVLRSACDFQRQWQNLGLPLIPLSINVSPVQFEQSTLIDTFAELVKKNSVSLHHLQLELSEDALFACGEMARNTLTELHDQGVRIAIDHFGKNHCSLAQLRRMPIDTIKIDHSLADNIHSSQDAKVVTEAIVQLCRTMDFNTVASGLENEENLPWLSEIHCKQAQGYCVSRPLNAVDLPPWYRQHLNGTAARRSASAKHR